MLESLFNKELQRNFIKKRLKHRCFLVSNVKSPANGCFYQTFRIRSGFRTTYSFKILFQHENITIISKIVNLRKKYFTILYNVYVMFFEEIQWFYQDFKNENLYFLNVYFVHAARILDLSLHQKRSFSLRISSVNVTKCS